MKRERASEREREREGGRELSLWCGGDPWQTMRHANRMETGLSLSSLGLPKYDSGNGVCRFNNQ